MCLVGDQPDMVDFSSGMLNSHLSPFSTRKSRNPTFTLSGKGIRFVAREVIYHGHVHLNDRPGMLLHRWPLFGFLPLQDIHKTINDNNGLKFYNSGWIYSCNGEGLVTLCPLGPGMPSSPERPFLPYGSKRRGMSRSEEKQNDWNLTVVYDHYLISS